MNRPKSEIVRYYKIHFPIGWEYYKKYPNDVDYSFWLPHNICWQDGGRWEVRIRYNAVVEVSKLEILVVLGEEALK